jgi:hypothetical protein
MTVGSDLGPTGLDLGIGPRSEIESFFIVEICFLVPADISSQHQRYNFWYRSTATDIKDEPFFMSHK